MTPSQATLANLAIIAGFVLCIATALILALTRSRKPDA